MNLESIGHPQISPEPSTKAIASFFGGFTLSDCIIRRPLGFPGMFSKAYLLHLEVPSPRESVEPGTAFSSHTAWSFWSKKKTVPPTDFSSDLGQHRSLRWTPIGVSCWYWVVSLRSEQVEASQQMSVAVLGEVPQGILGLPIPNTLLNYP